MGDPSRSTECFEPSIAGFFCSKCGDDCLSPEGKSDGDFPPSLKSVRIICAEKVGPDLVRQAFGAGSDGVLICGCLVGHCQTLDDNAAVLDHIHKTHMVMKEMDIAPGRLRQEWICASGGDKVTDIVTEFTELIRDLGPLENRHLMVQRENV